MRPDITLRVLDAELNVFSAVGVQIYNIHLDYSIFLRGDTESIQKADHWISRARQLGGVILLSDAGAEDIWASNSPNGKPIEWTEFKRKWVERVRDLASRYKPEYYIVVKEPAWYAPQIAVSSVPDKETLLNEIVALTRDLAETVRQVSPTTRIGVSVGSYAFPKKGVDYQYLVRLFQTPEVLGSIDFIGFDAYGFAEVDATGNFLDAHGNGGKEMWFAEVGPPTKEDWPGTKIEELARYIQDFASKRGFKAVVWTWESYLHEYGRIPPLTIYTRPRIDISRGEKFFLDVFSRKTPLQDLIAEFSFPASTASTETQTSLTQPEQTTTVKTVTDTTEQTTTSGGERTTTSLYVGRWGRFLEVFVVLVIAAILAVALAAFAIVRRRRRP